VIDSLLQNVQGMLGDMRLVCLLLFVDGATFSFLTTPLVFMAGQQHAPWQVAVFGGLSSAAGSAVQFAALRWILSSGHRWTRRFAPSRERLEATLRAYPSASFMAIVLARALPLPDAPIKLVAAALEYPVPRYGLAILIGALPYYYALAFAGNRIAIPGWVVAAALGVIALAFVLDRLRRRGRPVP
jgi:uncharacterized membrane protein YdjX (TVP38/TMEM64 family)